MLEQQQAVLLQEQVELKKVVSTSGSSSHMYIYILSYEVHVFVVHMYSCYFENVTPGESSGGYSSAVISGNCFVQTRIQMYNVF